MEKQCVRGWIPDDRLWISPCQCEVGKRVSSFSYGYQLGDCGFFSCVFLPFCTQLRGDLRHAGCQRRCSRRYSHLSCCPWHAHVSHHHRLAYFFFNGRTGHRFCARFCTLAYLCHDFFAGPAVCVLQACLAKRYFCQGLYHDNLAGGVPALGLQPMGYRRLAGRRVVSMLLFELTAFSIVAVYLVSQMKGRAKPEAFLARIVLLSAAGWMAEESSIVLYKFYSYNLKWSLFLGHVPVPVIIIWPVIIHSAWNLASQLLRPGHTLVPLAAAAIIFTDALLIEPVAENSGLWSWNEPGIFDVPPIAIFGWAYFAFLCILLFEHKSKGKVAWWSNLMVPVFAVIGTHLCLLVTWWGALRWINRAVDPAVPAGVAWAVSLLLVFVILRNRTGMRVDRKTLLLRLPAALLFFGLIAMNASGSALLAFYAVAFAPPYLTVMAQQYFMNRPQWA